MSDGRRECPTCKTSNEPDAQFCKQCKAGLSPRAVKKSPAAAGLIAALAPGAGHAYAGHALRGLAWMAAPLVAVGLAAFLLSETSRRVVEIVFGACLLAYVASIADAVIVTKRAARDAAPWQVAGVVVAGALLLPIVISFMMRAFMIEAFKIPAGSMIPSLAVGDHLFADKMVYRHRTPRRGEMAIFKYPEHPDQSFVKRVIGLPGDKIEARGGHPIINGWEVPSCSVGTFTYQEAYDGSGHTGELYVEFLEDEAYFTLYDTTGYGSEHQGPFSFPDYFVMGDNRHNSHDSRMWNAGNGGGVPASHFQGRARYLWFPRWADLTDPLIAPLPELAAPLAKCLSSRPTKTSPPKP